MEGGVEGSPCIPQLSILPEKTPNKHTARAHHVFALLMAIAVPLFQFILNGFRAQKRGEKCELVFVHPFSTEELIKT